VEGEKIMDGSFIIDGDQQFFLREDNTIWDVAQKIQYEKVSGGVYKPIKTKAKPSNKSTVPVPGSGLSTNETQIILDGDNTREIKVGDKEHPIDYKKYNNSKNSNKKPKKNKVNIFRR
jgi:hypothetical protein